MRISNLELSIDYYMNRIYKATKKNEVDREAVEILGILTSSYAALKAEQEHQKIMGELRNIHGIGPEIPEFMQTHDKANIS